MTVTEESDPYSSYDGCLGSFVTFWVSHQSDVGWILLGWLLLERFLYFTELRASYDTFYTTLKLSDWTGLVRIVPVCG